jgi:hypothetical protein
LGAASLGNLFVATTIGFSAVFLIGRAGEVVRPVVLPMRDPRVSPSAALVTILIERIYDFVAVALIFAINLIWFKPPIALEVSFSRVQTVGLGLLGGTILGIAFLIWFRKNSAVLLDALNRLFSRWPFIPARLGKLIVRLLEQLSSALRVLVNAAELAETVGWTALLWFGIASANLLVLRAFHLDVGISRANTGWCCRGLSCCHSGRTVIPGREERDSRGAVDRFTYRGLWTGSFIRTLLFYPRRFEYLAIKNTDFAGERGELI